MAVHLWERKNEVNKKIIQAVIDGTLNAIEEPEYRSPKVYVVSDDMGTKGVLNPVDGKMYDSKSSYEKAVKAAGCVIMGNDAPTKKAKPKQEKIDWEKAVAETIKTPR